MKNRIGINNRNSILMMLLSLFMASCNDLLDENPKSLAVETFYNTVSELETAVNAVYLPLRSSNTSGIGVYIAVLDAHVDYGYGRGSYGFMNDFQGLDNVNVSRVDGMWEGFYLSIRNANIVIKNAPASKVISSDAANKFVAEARFLRAFAYFQLVRNWGKVPLRTEYNMDQIDLGKSSVEDVYKLILDDLLFAEKELPEKQPNSGRPASWSAKTLLADVYLELKDYKNARVRFEEVINSGKYALVTVATSDDFQRIFGPDIITTSEEVFYLKFSHNPGQGNLWPELLNHPGTKLLGSGGVYGLHSDMKNPVYAEWDDRDLRKGMWYKWNIGVGVTSLLSNKFIDPNSAGWGGAANDQTWYRYADVLLSFAESKAREAGTPTKDAVEALNQVHRRAYGLNPELPSEYDFKESDYNLDSFIDLLIKERGYEFQYEGKRWLELKRTGKAAEIIKATKGKTIDPKAYLWPIPIREFSYNKLLDPVKDQNPGY